MPRGKTKKNKDTALEKTEEQSYIPSTPHSNVYGEYYNKNVVYIYKDNSSVRVTYDSKNSQYIERRYK